MKFGEIVRQARKDHGLTMVVLAKRIGSHKGYICGFEKGKVKPPSTEFIRSICRVLNLDFREMMILAYIEKAPAEIRDEMERRLAHTGNGTQS